MTKENDRYPRFSVLTSHDTAVWINQFMAENECSATELMRWLVSLARDIEEIEAEPGVRLAEARRGWWGWRIVPLRTQKPDRKVVPALPGEPQGKTHRSGLRIIDGKAQ